MWQMIEKIDISLFYMINRGGRNDFFDFLMPVVSNIKNFYVPLGLLWVLLILKKNVKCRTVAVGMLLLISFSEWISSGVLKPAFDRPRPYHALSYVHKYDRMLKTWSITPELKSVIKGKSYSLPSSHATNIFAAAYFLSFFFKAFWPFFYVVAFLVGYSRVYLGVHFPLDVLVGSIAGSLCGLLFVRLNRHVIRYFEKEPEAQ